MCATSHHSSAVGTNTAGPWTILLSIWPRFCLYTTNRWLASRMVASFMTMFSMSIGFRNISVGLRAARASGNGGRRGREEIGEGDGAKGGRRERGEGGGRNKGEAERKGRRERGEGGGREGREEGKEESRVSSHKVLCSSIVRVRLSPTRGRCFSVHSCTSPPGTGTGWPRSDVGM